MIRMIGIDHNNAPLDVRSVFTFRKAEMLELMEQAKERMHAAGAVLLTTCNRTELWVSTTEEKGSLLPVICDCKNVPARDYQGCFVERSGEDAVRHLFYLTCGLRSAIVAEDQILTQVGDALSFARAGYMTDGTLEVLFRMAVAAAKKVKTQVKFSHANVSAIEEAISMLEKQGFLLAGKKCMVIGNGEYGKLAALALRGKGADVTVTVRQYHSGVVLIPEGCAQIHYGEKMDYFPQCDLVVSATTSPNYTVYYDKVAQCRPDHPMILIDFAVPRDIEPQIAELPGYTLYNIDDFQTSSGNENAQAYREADAIIREQMHEFFMWHEYRDLMPRIGLIREKAVEDVHLRLNKRLHKLPVEEKQIEELDGQIRDASGKVIAKMLFMLRDSLDEESFRKCVSVIESGYLQEEHG